jgi:hypothetical protein
MNVETFVEWLRRQGHQIYRTTSSYWYDAGPRVLQAIPYHKLITPEKREIRDLMMKHGVIAVRYSTPIDYRAGMVSYHVELHQPYDLDRLKSQARNGVKRGLEHFRIEQISFERLATQGWALQYDTLVRQDRLRSMNQGQWERLCRSAEGLDGMEAWAATAGGDLAGALIICRIGNVFNVPYAMSRSCCLRDHVNNALFYAVSCDMLKRDGVSGVFFTVQSLDAPANVDEFKSRMGFEFKVVRQHVDFHPFARPFVTSTVHKWTQRLLQRDPSNPFLAKAEGMLNFHLAGRQSIAEQSWPECLANQKEALLPRPVKQPVTEAGGADLAGCQLPSVPRLSTGVAESTEQSPIRRLKRMLAVPWNYYVKRWLKRSYATVARLQEGTSMQKVSMDFAPAVPFKIGDLVRVRSREEINSTLDPFKELRGCAFLPDMYQYCGTQQRVFKSMQRFMDERDYKMKKVHGVILLENVICGGTPTFGACDRCCFLFWREEWLERIA